MWCENQISSHPDITLRMFSQLSLHLLRHNKPREKILSAYCRRKKVNPWWTSVVSEQLTLQTDLSSALKQQNWAVLHIKMTQVRLKPSAAKGLGVNVLHPSVSICTKKFKNVSTFDLRPENGLKSTAVKTSKDLDVTPVIKSKVKYIFSFSVVCLMFHDLLHSHCNITITYCISCFASGSSISDLWEKYLAL